MNYNEINQINQNQFYKPKIPIKFSVKRDQNLI